VKPSKRQRALQAALDALLETCRLRGIGSQHLQQTIHDACVWGVVYELSTPSLYKHDAARAEKISNAGLAAQLSFLREVWGMKKLTSFLEQTGGVLDAIVLHTSSNPEAIEEDIGRDNINADGDVV
jgi:hypothetical protein